MNDKLLKKLVLLSMCGVLLLGGFLVFGRQGSGKGEAPGVSSIREGTGKKEESKEDLRKMLGQNLIVGISGAQMDDKTKETLRYIEPAGIVLYSRNYESKTQFKKLISDLQAISKEETGFPYFIMLDEEPGGARRIGAFDNAFVLGLPDWNRIEEGIGTLEELGVNVELAPISDFPFNNDAFIKRRVPAKSVEDLSAFNSTFIDLLSKHKVSATLKHFPGLGVFAEDSHKKVPYSEVSRETFNRSLEIFKDGIDSGADFVMTGHAEYKNVDPENPATLSPKIVNGILKGELGFKGLVITDDLSEMALVKWRDDLSETGVQAIKAGHNLILFSHQLEKTKDIFDKMLKRAQSDPEAESVIADNYQKIIDLKKRKK